MNPRPRKSSGRFKWTNTPPPMKQVDQRDADIAAALDSSSWEIMSEKCNAHAVAMKEYVDAELEAYVNPGNLSAARLLVAEVALSRASKRLQAS